MFNREKDLIHRIINGMLLIWLIIALVLTVNSAMSLLMNENKTSYKAFKASGCSEYEYYEKNNTNLTEEQCESNYAIYEINYKNTQKNRKIYLYTTLCQVVFVSGTLAIINKKNLKSDQK